MTDLANRLNISKQSLSLYANGENIPPFENVVKIANELEFPLEFFITEDVSTVITDNTYFRSQASASKISQNAQKIKLEYVAKVYEVFLNFVNFPVKHLPPVNLVLSDNPLEVDLPESINRIENIAKSVRDFWKVGMGPIENLQFLLESNGIIITGFQDVDSTIDAFSQRIQINKQESVFVVN